jgi:hypothetical protein
MMKLLRSWWEAWRLAREAKRILADANDDILARMNAEYILRGLRRGALCRSCLKPFDKRPVERTDIFRLRAILSIPDSEPDPTLCPTCFEISVGAFNAHATNIGTSNSGPANLVLQKLN